MYAIRTSWKLKNNVKVNNHKGDPYLTQQIICFLKKLWITSIFKAKPASSEYSWCCFQQQSLSFSLFLQKSILFRMVQCFWPCLSANYAPLTHCTFFYKIQWKLIICYFVLAVRAVQRGHDPNGGLQHA